MEVPIHQNPSSGSPPPSRPLAGRVALVTGAASGIGLASALRLATDGARVAAADVNEAELGRAVDALRDDAREALGICLDVASPADWQAAMREVLDAWGRVDICINAAGIALAGPIPDLELSDWHRVLAVNLDGVFLGTKHAFRVMQGNGRGCIINIASEAGIEPYAGNAAYGTSKAAVRFFTRIAALEGAPLGIRVNSISPGAVATPMWRGTPLWPRQIEDSEGVEAALRALVRDHGFATPEQVAATVAFLAGDNALPVSGRDFGTDGRITRESALSDPT